MAIETPLPPRLAMIADEIEAHGQFGCVCDIGADHAKLLVWLASRGLCGAGCAMVATDVREEPLKKAARNLEQAGLLGAVRLVCCDGVAGLGELARGCAIVAAGMGGSTLAGIMERGASVARHAALVALQPMNNHATLRRKLAELGYGAIREKLAIDGSRVYVAIFCRWDGIASSQTPADYAIGKGEPAGTPEARLRYLRFSRKIAANRHCGLMALSRARALAPCEASELEDLAQILRQIDARVKNS